MRLVRNPLNYFVLGKECQICQNCVCDLVACTSLVKLEIVTLFSYKGRLERVLPPAYSALVRPVPANSVAILGLHFS